jgi:hypothetical protein
MPVRRSPGFQCWPRREQERGASPPRHGELRLAEPKALLQAQRLPAAVWAELLETAESGQPWVGALTRIAGWRAAYEVDPNGSDFIPPIPQRLGDPDGKLPGLDQDETLALLDRYCDQQAGELRAGVTVHLFPWLYLVATHVGRRESLRALEELVQAELLREVEGGTRFVRTNVRWPLVVTPALVAAMRDLRRRTRLPIWVLRLEEFLAGVHATVPTLLAVVTWLVAGIAGTIVALGLLEPVRHLFLRAP